MTNEVKDEINNFEENIKTPEDAARLIRDREAAHKVLVDAATEAYKAYFSDIATRGNKLADQIHALSRQREEIAKGKEKVKASMVSATVNDDADSVKAQQKKLKELDLQIASLDEQIETYGGYVLNGNPDLFKAALDQIEKVSEDAEAMREYFDTIKAEANRREQEWLSIYERAIDYGKVPDAQKLRDASCKSPETVAARMSRLDKVKRSSYKRMIKVKGPI